MKPIISVIIPVLNRKALLLRCLESILCQYYRPLEVIIVDNGSTDGTLEEAARWGSLNSQKGFEVKILSESKPGACAARNRGLREAQGEFTIFFDSDDTMRHDLIARAEKEFEKNPDCELVCWRCVIHRLDGSVRAPAFNPASPLEDHLVNALLRTQGYMASTLLFRKVGGWNESLPAWNDWELGVRILLENPSIIAIPDPLADIYAQKVSITGADFSSKAGLWEKSLNSVRKIISASSNPDKSHLADIVTYREIILAAHYAKEGKPHLAANLKNEALSHFSNNHNSSNSVATPLKKLLLSLSYHYTKNGGRGAWRILNKFF